MLRFMEKDTRSEKDPMNSGKKHSRDGGPARDTESGQINIYFVYLFFSGRSFENLINKIFLLFILAEASKK